MPTELDTSSQFERQFKRLSRKHRGILGAIISLSAAIGAGEVLGDRISGLEYEVYKIRLSVPEARLGKRRGFRVIVYVESPSRAVFVYLYSKSEQTTISNAEIRRIILEAPT